LLSRSVLQKKLEKKGVDAIFSRDEEKGRPGLFVASLAILVGLALWTINIVGVQRPSYFGPSGLDSYSSLVLGPLGLLLVISGVGVSLALRTPPSLRSSQKTTGNADTSVELQPSARPISFNSLRLGIVAFLETLFIITLYAGVLDEYQSNPSMQDWVRRTLPSTQILLSYPALIVFSGILALLFVQFLPGRRLYEKVA
jgi:hypothetical protein